MEFEKELFFGYKLDLSKLESYGFILKDDHYFRSFPLEINNFHVEIDVFNNDITGHIYDETFGDEYILFRNEKVVGEFVGSIREAYKKVLIGIRDHCFIRVMFMDEQSSRIAQYIIKTYGDNPEFPWKKFPEFAIFRNRNNHRWYAIFMTVKDGALGENVSARSIVNIKPCKEDYQKLVEQNNIYPGWHMDKKSWISVSLSNYFPDEYIVSLIDMSYRKVNGQKK